MSSKLEPVIWLRDTGHIGIHGGADGQTYVRTYVRMDVHDAMAIKPNFLTSMGLPYFLSYGAPRVCTFGARRASLLTDILDNHAPLVQKRIAKPKPFYFNSEVIAAIRCRNQLKRKYYDTKDPNGKSTVNKEIASLA